MYEHDQELLQLFELIARMQEVTKLCTSPEYRVEITFNNQDYIFYASSIEDLILTGPEETALNYFNLSWNIIYAE